MGSGRVMSGMTIATRSCAATQLPQRLAADGAAHRRDERRRLVWKPWNERRLDDAHALRRDLHVEAIASVLQVNPHDCPRAPEVT